jgi:hypothetical protein
MLSRVCCSLIVLSTWGVGSVQSQGYQLPDVVLPTPLSSTIRDTGRSLLLGARAGFGWSLSENSTAEVFAHLRSALPGFLIRKTGDETECYRKSLVVGTQTGVDHEWYIGSGVSAGVDGGVSVLSRYGLPFYAGIRLTWFPTEGLGVTLRFDPFWGLEPEWTIKP